MLACCGKNFNLNSISAVLADIIYNAVCTAGGFGAFFLNIMVLYVLLVAANSTFLPMLIFIISCFIWMLKLFNYQI